MQNEDYKWMTEALIEAQKAAQLGEVPVGAIVVCGDQIVARSHNQRESQNNPTAHAEVIAINEASKKLNSWRLNGCTLYVTLEPCLMCAGAIVQSRIDRVVYGAHDLKAGAVKSLYTVLKDERLNHNPEVSDGILGEEAATLMKSFFRDLRFQKKSKNNNPISEEKNV